MCFSEVLHGYSSLQCNIATPLEPTCQMGSQCYLPPDRGAIPARSLAVTEWLARPTAVWEYQGSNLTADGCVYRECHYHMQPWARSAHLYCSAYVNSALHLYQILSEIRLAVITWNGIDPQHLPRLVTVVRPTAIDTEACSAGEHRAYLYSLCHVPRAAYRQRHTITVLTCEATTWWLSACCVVGLYS